MDERRYDVTEGGFIFLNLVDRLQWKLTRNSQPIQRGQRLLKMEVKHIYEIRVFISTVNLPHIRAV
jgi:hypothetical protein